MTNATHIAHDSTGLQATRGAQLWRERLDLLLESTGEGVFGVDMQGNCIFINRAAPK